MTRRPWEIWSERKYASFCLKDWGNPTLPPEEWDINKYRRLRGIRSLIVGNTVLDVGCGLGHLYALLRDKKGLKYRGIDSSSIFIQRCKKFFPEANFEVGDIYNLSNEPVYDTVIAIQLLIHLPDFKEPLQQLWDHTGKRLIFTLRALTKEPALRKRENGLLLRRHTEEEYHKVLNSLGNVRGFRSTRLNKILYVMVERKKLQVDIQSCKG